MCYFLRFDCGKVNSHYSILYIAPLVILCQRKKNFKCHMTNVTSTCWKEFIHFTIYTSNEVIHFYFGIYSSESKLSIWLTLEINSFWWQWITHTHAHTLTSLHICIFTPFNMVFTKSNSEFKKNIIIFEKNPT